ncbi:MAG: D-alanyl-D-alanine endopeptidase [bacterium]
MKKRLMQVFVLLTFGVLFNSILIAAEMRSWDGLDHQKLSLKSKAALVIDSQGNEVYGKQADQPMPIASITKLMTAMVIIDSGISLDEKISITKDDRDLIRLTGSRLKYGASLTRKEMLWLAVMSSENRAAAALARTYPGGTDAFIDAMNSKAKALGMSNSHFVDSVGLSAGNLASPRDLAKMVKAAASYDLIREATTASQLDVRPYRKKGPLRYGNTNRLLKNSKWDIDVSKTGYINEAGRCLVMQAEIADEPMTIIFLNSFGKLTPFGDSNRLRKWIEQGLGSNI